jgi:hypothetical protein
LNYNNYSSNIVPCKFWIHLCVEYSILDVYIWTHTTNYSMLHYCEITCCISLHELYHFHLELLKGYWQPTFLHNWVPNNYYYIFSLCYHIRLFPLFSSLQEIIIKKFVQLDWSLICFDWKNSFKKIGTMGAKVTCLFIWIWLTNFLDKFISTYPMWQLIKLNMCQVDHKVFYQHEDGHIDYWSNITISCNAHFL